MENSHLFHLQPGGEKHSPTLPPPTTTGREEENVGLSGKAMEIKVVREGAAMFQRLLSHHCDPPTMPLTLPPSQLCHAYRYFLALW